MLTHSALRSFVDTLTMAAAPQIILPAHVAITIDGSSWLSFPPNQAERGVLRSTCLFTLEQRDAGSRTFTLRQSSSAANPFVSCPDTGPCPRPLVLRSAPDFTKEELFRLTPLSYDNAIACTTFSGNPVAVGQDGCTLECIDPTKNSLAGARLCVFSSPALGALTAQFALNCMDGCKIVLWGLGCSRWVTMHPLSMFGSGGEVTCKTEQLLVWEQFTLKVLDASKQHIALLSTHGYYLSAEPSGKLTANKREIGVWERFTLHQHLLGSDANPCVVSLFSTHDKFVSSRDPHRMSATATELGPSERFLLLDAAVCCAAFWERPLPPGELLVPLVLDVDASAGDLADF